MGTSYGVQSVTQQISRSNDSKGTMSVMTSETTVGTKKTSYSEKVALFAKESIFTKDGNNSDNSAAPDADLFNKTNDNNTNSNEPTSTAMVSVDDEPIIPGVDDDVLQGEVVSSQIITSRSRTVETTTYCTDNDGDQETRVEQKVTIQSDGEPIDHDEALAQAIQEATAMNPDMTVE